MIKKCVWYGAEFSAPPSSKKITCSRDCSVARRKKMLTGVKRTDSVKTNMSKSAKERQNYKNLLNGTDAAKNSAKGGRFETNASAKTWKVIHPDYGMFEFTNLSEWIRNHIDFFDCELSDKNVYRIAHGFYTAKKNMLKKANTVTYKEWSILYVSLKNCDKD